MGRRAHAAAAAAALLLLRIERRAHAATLRVGRGARGAARRVDVRRRAHAAATALLLHAAAAAAKLRAPEAAVRLLAVVVGVATERRRARLREAALERAHKVGVERDGLPNERADRQRVIGERDA